MKQVILILSLLFVCLFSCAHRIERKIANVGTESEDGEVYIFVMQHEEVMIVRCMDGTTLTQLSDCKRIWITSPVSVKIRDFKNYLMNTIETSDGSDFPEELAEAIKAYKNRGELDLPKPTEEELKLQMEIDKLVIYSSKYIVDDNHFAKVQALQKQLKAEWKSQEDKYPSLIPIHEIEGRLNQLVDDIISSKNLTVLKESLLRDSFDYKILRRFVKSNPLVILSNFVKIPAGKFMMGSNPSSDIYWDRDETLHQVIISKDFEIMTTEVTQEQWYTVMGYNNSRHISRYSCDNAVVKNSVQMCPNNPVENVSWEDVQVFIKKLNDAQSKFTYRLPTEAEWEYAARAGADTPYVFGKYSSLIKKYGWTGWNSGDSTQKVGVRKPNKFGLYDIHGNVWEWVNDWYGPLGTEEVTDPVGPNTGERRVYRGGSCEDNERFGYLADRGIDIGNNPGDYFGYVSHTIIWGYPNERSRLLGFRLARSPR